MPRLAKQEKEPTEAQLAARAAGAERLRAASQARRVQPVRSTRQFTEAAEQQVGQDRPRDLKSTGPAREALEPLIVEPVDGPLDQEHAANLAFMEEVITVLVHESTNPTEQRIPEVWNDGRREFFVRGEEKQVKRKFVEVLARMKRTVYSQQKVTDDNGIESYRNVPHTAPQYPFTVTQDTPKGHAWLKKVLAEG